MTRSANGAAEMACGSRSLHLGGRARRALLRELAAGRYVVEPADKVPDLSRAEGEGLRQAMSSSPGRFPSHRSEPWCSKWIHTARDGRPDGHEGAVGLETRHLYPLAQVAPVGQQYEPQLTPPGQMYWAA